MKHSSRTYQILTSASPACSCLILPRFEKVIVQEKLSTSECVSWSSGTSDASVLVESQ